MIPSRFIPIFLVLIVGCGNPPGENTGVPPSRDNTDDLVPFSSQIVYPKGWTEVIITANSAKTTIDSGAHLSTTRNACGKEKYAPLEVGQWNEIAKYMNLVVETGFGSEDYCVSPPESEKSIDGSAELRMQEGNAKKVLYEYKDGQICTKISDHKTSDLLLGHLNKLVDLADKIECPNGWGSD